MGVSVATNTVNDDLFFGYDTGYDVANPSNIHRYYAGEPTTNLMTVNLETSGVDGSGQSSVGTRTVISNNHVRIVDIGSNTRQTHVFSGLTAGSTYTVSIQFRKISGTPTFRFQIQAYNNGSYTSTIKFTNTAETGLLDIDGWQTAKWTFTLPSGNNGCRIWWQDGADYTTYDHSFELRNPQLELKGHATNYVSGTRSNTNSLIDLKRTKTIDLSNVSFNSSQDLDFDGTNDKIELGNHLNNIGSNATFDMVFKCHDDNSTNYRVMIGWGAGNNNYSSIGLGNLTGSYTGESLHVILNASTHQMYVTSHNDHAYYKDGKFHHLVVTVGYNNYSIWVDGEEMAFVNASGLQSTHFPEVVGYNSNITAQVGQRPYGGGNGHFSGEIPVMRIYKKILTDAEILQNYAAYKNRFDL